MAKYLVEFVGKIIVEARDDDDALYTLGQLTGDELLNAIDSTSTSEPTPAELKYLNHYKAADYL
jgi:hypothetical protein